MLSGILVAVVVLFPISEIALAGWKRAKTRSATKDRGSMGLLWLVIGASIFAAAVLQRLPATTMRAPAVLVQLIALGLLLVGLVVRWIAILTLGRFFTVKVAIQPDHSLVDTGLYRYVRHPSYSGLILAFLGLGIFFDNWLSLAVLMVPIVLALLWRITIEERALRDALGLPYVEYSARTKRLVPGLF